MAVFTPVVLDDLRDWITQFPLGAIKAVRGISSGIENSNFFIDTERGEFVLTIFEVLSFQQLPFYLELMRHLAQHGVLVPEPVATHQGDLLAPLHGKPAAIVSKLNGASQMQPQAVHCAEVARMLARMHMVGSDFSISQPNLRGLAWWHKTVPIVLPYIDADKQHLLTTELHFQEAFAASPLYKKLPRGPIHADLFRNNVMFEGERLTGFFDFYFAGEDTWLFDVAVTINDWCIDLTTGELDQVRLQAFLQAYHEVRPFTAAENSAWPACLRAAALRFWLSRLYDYYLPREAEVLTPHDPTHFERILRLREAHPELVLPQ